MPRRNVDEPTQSRSQVGLNAEVQKRAKQAINDLHTRNLAYSLVAVVFFILLIGPASLYALQPTRSNPVIVSILELVFEVAFAFGNLIAVGVILLISIWMFKKLRRNWRTFRPPYDEKELVVQTSEVGSHIQTVNKGSSMALIGFLLNFIYIGVISKVHDWITTNEEKIIPITSKVQNRFNTEGFENFLDAILNISISAVREIGLTSVVGYVLLIIGGSFALLSILNLEFLLRQGVLTYKDYRDQHQCTRFQAVKTTVKNAIHQWNLLSFLFVQLIDEMLRGELQEDSLKLLLSTILFTVLAVTVLWVLFLA